ncbi:MAG: acetylornithine deacetylase [Planctomycetota bacterium]|jgi:acetylornithine deacetylase
MHDLARTLVEWIEIPSVTGDEEDYGDALSRALAAAGFAVERQEVEPGRSNILARAGAPEVVFCTHLDTVPPFYGSRVDRDFVYGRGSCDAKGQAATMLAAGRELLASGEDRFGFLFTVGEETTSDGASRANELLADPWNPRYTIIGEPTSNAFVSGHKGIFQCSLHGKGVAGHSSQPIGPSAVHELVKTCARIIESDWGQHPVFGPGTVNLGEIAGGVASNVIADKAQASFLLRAVEDPPAVEARLRELIGEHVELVLSENRYGPIKFHVPEGEDAEVVAFGTDAPHMKRWGTPLLFGAGAIMDAHTDHEKVGLSELEACAARHVRTARELLAT